MKESSGRVEIAGQSLVAGGPVNERFKGCLDGRVRTGSILSLPAIEFPLSEPMFDGIQLMERAVNNGRYRVSGILRYRSRIAPTGLGKLALGHT